MGFKVLFDGYSEFKDNIYRANCSCVLVKGPPNVIVDTMTAWDEEKLLKALKEESVDCKDIEYVVCTHGHSDHIGCNHLFKHAKHIVGFSVSHKDQYYTEPCFQAGEEYIISDKIKVIPTPGHTMQDVTVILETDVGIVAITGDLFEKFEDLENDQLWKSAGSDSEELQMQNRKKYWKLPILLYQDMGLYSKCLKYTKTVETMFI